MAAEPGHGGIENGRCFAEAANITSPPLIQNGELTFQAHHVGWLVCGFFASVAVVTSFWLVDKHLVWYTNKAEQRQIVRLLLMVPIYAVVSLLSYIYWNHSTAIVLMRDCYESFVLYSFFYLLLLYVSNDPMEQREIFKHVKLDKWMFPLGFVKWRPEDGLYFLQLMKWGVLQYSVIRPLCTLASVGLNYVGLYCELSYSPAWGHVWLVSIVSISVSVAMYCLFQFYFAVKQELAPQKPLLKLFSIKAVVFLTFWQATFLGVLATFGLVKDTKYMTAEDINIGIGAILETFEMMLFAFLHVKAFSYHPYKDKAPDGKPIPRLRGLRHAFWYRDMWKEFKEGCVYLWRRMRGQEAEKLMRKQIHLENAMGRSRRIDRGPGGAIRPQPTRPKEGMPGERPELPWLNVDNDGLEMEVGMELEKRGMGSRTRGAEHDQEMLDARGIGHSRKQASWWRRAYDRVSGRASGDEQYAELHSPTEKLRSPRSPGGKFDDDDIDMDPLDEPPPPSIIFKNPNKPRGSGVGARYAQVANDEPDEDGRRRDRRDRRERGQRGEYAPQRSKPVAPIDFSPRADHHRDDDTTHPLRLTTDASRVPLNNASPLELSRSPPPGAVRGPPELSRSPPPRAAMLNVPAPPQSVARSDSLLGRVFASPAQDETAVSHADNTSEGALSRSISLASDHRQQVKEVEPRSIAAVMGQAPTVESFALDGATQTGAPSVEGEQLEQRTRHRVDATLPPLPPSSPSPESAPPPTVPEDVPLRPPASPQVHTPDAARQASPRAIVPPPTPAVHAAGPESPSGQQEERQPRAQRYSVPVGPPPRGIPRPNKLVMPGPLSPARYPADSSARVQAEPRSFQTSANSMPGPGTFDPRAQPRRNEFSPPAEQRGYDVRHPPRPDDPQRGRPYDPRQGPPPQSQDFSRPSRRDGADYRRDVRPPPRENYPPPQQYEYDPRRQDLSPPDRGRPLYRGEDPRYSRQYPVQYPPPPPLPGLDYLPPAPPGPHMSPPRAAMFPSSPITSPERGPYPSHPPSNSSPSRVMRLPRDDVPMSRPEPMRNRSSMSVDPNRDVVGAKHPTVQRMAASSARRTTLDSNMQFAPVSPGEVLRPMESQGWQDRRQSAPVGYGQPQQHHYASPPRQYVPPHSGQRGGPYAPQHQQHVFSDPQHARRRPQGAAAPHVSSPQAQAFPETISPTPIRPSPNHVTTLTPRSPEPATGLVPYVLRSERTRDAADAARAPWT